MSARIAPMTRGIRPHRSNRFIRFGYRRSPPWKPPKPTRAASVRPQHLRNPEVYNSWRELRNEKARIQPLPSNQDPSVVPALAHGIDVVLRGDGIYPLEAPWLKKKYKYYSDSLRKIVQPSDIAWSNIPGYIPAASDSTLHNVAEQHGARFSSSTSSITPTIAAMYHLLSNFRNTGLQGGLSAHVRDLPSDFSKFHRRPVAFTITRNGTGRTYSINAHDGMNTGPSILRDLGHSMERMLTTAPQEFKRKFVLSRSNSDSEVGAPSGTDEQFFHYSRISNFVLRAQIDCRNPDNGEVFDVKTRAVAPIRYDLDNYQAHTSHKIRFLQGPSDSYEREFYDMVRTVFLKYALQLRIGRMSGALVAYHNTTEVLGLEYISLKEIESYVFGSQHWADIAFGTAVKLLEEVVETVLAKMTLEDGEKLKVVLSTEWSQLKMHIFAQRIRDGRDPLAHDQFFSKSPAGARKTTNQAEDNFSPGGMWHVDGSFQRGLMGVSIIGAHPLIEKMGGELITHRPAAVAKRKRTIDESRLKHIVRDMSHLAEDDLHAWEMKVVPFVNNEVTPKSTFSMNKSDSFRLKYSLTELSVDASVMEKFLVSLGRIYIK